MYRDALDSKSSVRKDVRVRVSPEPPFFIAATKKSRYHKELDKSNDLVNSLSRLNGNQMHIN